LTHRQNIIKFRGSCNTDKILKILGGVEDIGAYGSYWEHKGAKIYNRDFLIRGVAEKKVFLYRGYWTPQKEPILTEKGAYRGIYGSF